jgi:TatD DNase family protein
VTKSRVLVIDGHAHLDELEGMDDALAEAMDAGVVAIIGVGMCVKSNRKILDAAERYTGFILPAIGYHPWEVRKSEIDENLLFLEENLDPCVAIGEVGLDYRVRVKRDLQKEAFEEIVRISLRQQRPLILHCRGSHKDVFSMISNMGVRKAVFHWYTASLDLLGEIVSAGYYISATPALAYSPPHREAIAGAPLERILLETDCPVRHQGRATRPCDVLITLGEVSRLKGLSVEEVAERTTQNVIELFGPLGAATRHS